MPNGPPREVDRVPVPAAPRKLETLRHRSPLAAWEYVFADPAPALAGIVRRSCAYRERTAGPLRRRELPGAQLVLIVDLGPTLTVVDRARPDRRDRFAGGFAAGLDDGHTITETAGAMSGVQLDLTPLGGRLLLGRLAAALAGRVAALGDLDGPFRGIAERLGNLETPEERFSALDRLLLEAVARAAPLPGWTRWAAEQLEASGGRAPVVELNVMLADEFPEHGCLAPTRGHRGPVSLHLYVEDVDAVVARAASLGGRVERAVEDRDYGDRRGDLVDPFGHRWLVATHLADVRLEELQRRQSGAAQTPT